MDFKKELDPKDIDALIGNTSGQLINHRDIQHIVSIDASLANISQQQLGIYISHVT